MKRTPNDRIGLGAKRDPASTELAIDEIAARWISRRDATLSPGEHAELQSWLDADPRHRAALRRYDSAWAVLDLPVQAGAENDILAELNTLDRSRRRFLTLTLGAAAAVLLTAIGFWNFPGEKPGDPTYPHPKFRVHAPARQELADGSIVELKEGAEIAADFGPTLRRITLRRGEAHFQVQKDAARPFVVMAGGIEVRAVGTGFAVQLGQGKIEIFVTEGRVAVDNSPSDSSTSTASGNSAIAIPTLVTAGERAVIGLKAAKPEVAAISAPEMGDRLSWRATRLEFSGTPLSEAIVLFNRHAAQRQNVQFAIEDPTLARLLVSGLFRANNTDAFVDILETNFGIKAVPRSETEFVLQKAD